MGLTGQTGPTGLGFTGPTGTVGTIGATGEYYGDYLSWNPTANAWTAQSENVILGQNSGLNNLPNLFVDTSIPKASITPSSSGQINEYYGNSISINSSGDTLAVGAWGFQNGATTQAGRVLIYKVNNTLSWTTTFTQTATLTPVAVSSERFGFSVSFNSGGDTLAVGAPRFTNSGNTTAGRVLIYKVANSSSWGSTTPTVAILTPSIIQSNEFFGFSVSFNSAGDTLAVGAYGYTNLGTTNAGRVLIYKVANSSSWITTSTQNAILSSGSGEFDEKIGWSVSLNSIGDTIAVGAPGYFNASPLNRGRALIYKVANPSSWINRSSPTARLTVTTSGLDDFGTSVSLNSDGDTVAIGAPYNQNGRVLIYKVTNSSSWINTSTPTAQLTSTNGGMENLGTSVSLNSAGDTVAIGAPAFMNSAGRVLIYNVVSPVSWVNTSTPTAILTSSSTGELRETFGTSVSLISSGGTVAVGAPFFQNGTNQNAGRVLIMNGIPINRLAIGVNAGQSQNQYAIAIGFEAGKNTQGTFSVAIGYQAGLDSSSTGNVAIGYQAGEFTQGLGSVAIGSSAGSTSQNSYAIAIGFQAGQNTQGTYSVAIGYQAGQANQHANSIILNASTSAVNSGQASSFYVKPVRNVTNSNFMLYDSTNSELTYFSSSNYITGGNLATDIGFTTSGTITSGGLASSATITAGTGFAVTSGTSTQQGILATTITASTGLASSATITAGTGFAVTSGTSTQQGILATTITASSGLATTTTRYTYTTLPTLTTGMIGYTYSPAFNAWDGGASSTFVIASQTIPVGIWLIVASVSLTLNGATGGPSILNLRDTGNILRIAGNNTSLVSLYIGTIVYSAAASTTIILRTNSTSTTPSAAYDTGVSFLTLTRIA